MKNKLKLLIEKIIKEELNESFKSFNLKHFKNIIDNDLKDGIQYAKKHLPFMGQGTSRVVFAIGKGKVLKIASDDDFGTEQNKSEIETYKKVQDFDLVAKIYDYDKSIEPAWLISEAVKVIGQHKDLLKLFNSDIDFRDTLQTIAEWRSKIDFETALKTAIKNSININSIEDLTEYDLEFAKKSFLAGRKYNITDVERFSQWGFTADKRLVIVDYGIESL